MEPVEKIEIRDPEILEKCERVRLIKEELSDIEFLLSYDSSKQELLNQFSSSTPDTQTILSELEELLALISPKLPFRLDFQSSMS